MKKCIFFLCLLLSAIYTQSQTTVHVNTPGTLSDLLGDDKATITHLVVTGSINDADFTAIKGMTKLSVLNLQDVTTTGNQIPNQAFQSKAYEQLILPNTVEIIGSQAFQSSNIKNLVIPGSVTMIRNNAFSSAQMKGIDLSKAGKVKTIETQAFREAKCDTLDLSALTQWETMGIKCFDQGTYHLILPKQLRTVTFPQEFAYFRGSVELEEGLKVIETSCFLNANMSKLVLPNTVETIGNQAFGGSNIAKLNIPESVTNIKQQAFSSAQMGGVDFSKAKNIKTIETQAFYQAKCDTLDLSGLTGWEAMGIKCFDQGTYHLILPKQLRTVTFPQEFAYFRGSVELEEGLKVIETNCFLSANMDKVILPNTVEEIKENAFQSVTLNLLVLPNTLQEIRAGTFQASNIKELVIPASVTTIKNNAFYGTQMAGVDFSKASKVKTIEYQAFREAKCDTLDLSTLTQWETMGIKCFDQGTYHLILPKQLRTVTFPQEFAYFRGSVELEEGLKVIETSCFLNANMSKLVLPNTVETIGNQAFGGSNIAKLNIPESVTNIKQQAFSSAQMKGIDLSRARNVKTIETQAFYQAKCDTLDLSALTQWETMGIKCFDQGTYHLILPKQLRTVTFPQEFAYFRGSVELEEGLKVIETNCFLSANMDKVILPNTVEEIKSSAFQSSNIKEMVIPGSVTTIRQQAFSSAQMGGIDFSKAKNIKTIETQAFWQAKCDTLDLSGLTGWETMGIKCFDQGTYHLILPKQLRTVTFPQEFAYFRGSVELEEGLKVIETNCFLSANMGKIDLPGTVEEIKGSAFQSSNIPTIILPAKVNNIGNQAFYGCSQLTKITSLNPNPPALGTNVFQNVNKENCTLEVPAGSVYLYAAADQWKDFLNIQTIAPDTIPLVFKMPLNVKGFYVEDCPGCEIKWTENAMDVPPGVEPIANQQPMMPTKGTRIGEYYWTDVFNMKVPHFAWWNANIGSIERYPVDEVFGMYLLQCHIDYEDFQPDAEEFRKYYGSYYDRDTYMYINYYGVMFENFDSIDVNQGLTFQMNDLPAIREIVGPGWGMPYVRDYRQLVGMLPFFNGEGPVMDELDVRTALSARPGENPLAYNIDNGTALRTYWFTELNQNLYGFNMMPTGSRLHAKDANWSNGLYREQNILQGTPWEDMAGRNVIYYYDENGNTYPVDQWWGPKGAFAHLFYTVSYAAQDGQLFIHDRVDTGGGISYSAMTTRWCRRLTDSELGYKLFVKVNNINTASAEWTSFAEGNEIPLLKAVKTGTYQRSDFDIVNIDNPEAEAPQGYIELPNGYIRGFYVNYFIENPASGKSLEDVILYAISVDDNALDVPSTRSEADSNQQTGIINVNGNNIEVYPNPVSDWLHINTGQKLISVAVMNITGAVVKASSNSENPLDVSSLAAGTYMLRIETANGIYTTKFIKK